MPQTGPTELILLPALKAMRGPKGGLVLTQKYLNGAAAYAEHWPGPVTSLVELDTVPTTDMDHVEVMPGTASTGLELRPSDPETLAARLQNAAIVLAFLSRYELATAQLCRQIGVPIVFTSEYSARTERQIVRAQTRNPILRLRRQMWVHKSERLRRKVLTYASGLQCSGTPTYEAYRNQTANTLLFFDNRVPQGNVIADDAFAAKTAQMQADAPLRLVFGGRLIAMKGVLDLPRLAEVLRDRDVPFTLDIYGNGPLERSLAVQLTSMGLNDQVTLHGALDFETGWIPALKTQADLFICCHPQGDPSSTYPEVMACGVPIAGYDNEALSGIVAQSKGGWSTPTHDLEALAEVVAQLHDDRAELVATATRARAFARDHAFEATMTRRSQHLITTSRLPDRLRLKALETLTGSAP